MDRNNLMDVYLDRLFNKYDISPDKTDLSPEQRKKVKNIVENIQNDVQRFLANVETKVTEKDMEQQNSEEDNSNEEASPFDLINGTPEPPKTKPKVYLPRKKRKK